MKETINGINYIRFDWNIPLSKKSINHLDAGLKSANAIVTKMEFDDKWYYLNPRLTLVAYVPEDKAEYFSNY